MFQLILSLLSMQISQDNEAYNKGDDALVSTNSVCAVKCLDNGKLLIGTSGGELIIYDPVAKVKIVVDSNNSLLRSSEAVCDICFCRDIIYLLTSSGAVHIYEYFPNQNKDSIKYVGKLDVGRDSVLQILTDTKRLYVLTKNYQLLSFDSDKSAIARKPNIAMSNAEIFALFGGKRQDDVMMKLVSTRNGVAIFISDTEKFFVYDMSKSKKTFTGIHDSKLHLPIDAGVVNDKLIILHYMKYVVVSLRGNPVVTLVKDDFRNIFPVSAGNVALLVNLDRITILNVDRNVATEMQLPASITSFSECKTGFYLGLDSHDTRDNYRGGSVVGVMRVSK